MSEGFGDKIVYDCNVYLQFLLNRNGPSGRCVSLALENQIQLFVSDEVLKELLQLPDKPFCLRAGITSAVIEEFIAVLTTCVTHVGKIPQIFEHPIDPDDSPYVNLAIASGAKIIVSRDNHLLNLISLSKPWSVDFRKRFPEIRVLQPQQYLADRDGKTGPNN